jgi:DNA-binding MarR family transcriptional regulator
MNDQENKVRRSIGRMISILHRHAQAHHNHNLKDCGINATDLPILLYLYHCDGSTQDAIVNFLDIDKAAVTRTVQSLEERGYIVRHKGIEDRRCNHLHLTEQARLVEKNVRDSVRSWNAMLTETMDMHTLNIIINGLEEMVDKVETIKKGASK